MVRYTQGEIPAAAAVAELYQAAGLWRPIHDLDRLESMYRHSNLVLCAWVGERLIGVSRALTGFSYCYYLSDLAVHPDGQGQGIGRALIGQTRPAAGPGSMLLLAAPGALTYYPRQGFDRVCNAFQLPRIWGWTSCPPKKKRPPHLRCLFF